MIGGRQRRAAWTAVALVVALALALPAFAVADATPAAAGAATGSLGGGGEALSYWTPARLEAAEPLPIVTVPGAPPAGARTAAVGSRAVARAAAVQGVEVDAAESTVYPNSAIGKLFGVFKFRRDGSGGSEEIVIKKYACSGSVVRSRRGDVVLTAGHCVIDPETGAVASSVVFIPGYREGLDPHGVWEAGAYATTEAWKETVGKTLFGKSMANEGGDLALLVLSDNAAGESVEAAAGGSLEIAFDSPFMQLLGQTYTQYGYPAEVPYEREVLYSHTARHATFDINPFFSPTPLRIASDFTQGASGGPWTIGPSDAPGVASLTAYGYDSQPGYLYGPYLGDEARAAYRCAAGEETEGACGTLSEAGSTAAATVSDAGGDVASAPTPTATPPTAVPALRVKKIRRRADGSAVVVAKVDGAGRLKLSGPAVRADSLHVSAAGRYRLKVKPKKAADRRLRRRGRATVRVRIAFSAAGKTRRITKRIHLRQRSLTHRITHHTAARRD